MKNSIDTVDAVVTISALALVVFLMFVFSNMPIILG